MNDNLSRKHVWCFRCAYRGRHSALGRRTRRLLGLCIMLLCLIGLHLGPLAAVQVPARDQLSDSVHDLAVRHLRGVEGEAAARTQRPGLYIEKAKAVHQPRLLKLGDLALTTTTSGTFSAGSPASDTTAPNFKQASTPAYGRSTGSDSTGGNVLDYGCGNEPPAYRTHLACVPVYGGKVLYGRTGSNSSDANGGSDGTDVSGNNGTGSGSSDGGNTNNGNGGGGTNSSSGSGGTDGNNKEGSGNGKGNGTTNGQGASDSAPSPSPSPPPQFGGNQSTSGSSSSSGSGGRSGGSTVCSRNRLSAPTAGASAIKGNGSECGSKLVAVTFVVPSAAASAAASGSGTAAAVVMCAEPAAYSAETGTLSMAFCWRQSDMPDALLTALAAAATATATAAAGSATAAGTGALLVTLPRLERYGISAMAAGDYSLAVTGAAGGFGAVVHPAAAAAADATFGPYAADAADAGGGSGNGLVTLPPGGATAVTFWFSVVVSGTGNDQAVDNAAAVGYINLTMVGPPNPPQPATTCKCPATAATPTGCASGLAPLIATGGDGSVFVVQCVPTPAYDKISRKLSFSACWRYACLQEGFARLPYTLLLGPLSAEAVGSPPAGTYQLRSTAPDGVAMSYQWTAANDSRWSVAAATGAGVPVTVPAGGLGQIRMMIEVPFDLTLDDSAGTLELSLLQLADTTSGSGDSSTGGGSGSGGSASGGGMVLETPDGSVTTPPMMPEAASAANAVLTVVSELWVAQRLGGGSGGQQSDLAALEALVRQRIEAGQAGSSSEVNVSVSLVGFRLVLPLEFRDFSAVADCGQASLDSLRAAAAAALGGAATLRSVGCSYGAYSGGSGSGARRSRLLQQQQQQQACAARLNAPVSVDTAPMDLDAFLASATTSLTSAYGSSACELDPGSSSIQVTSKLAISVAMPAARMVASSSGSGTGGSPVSDSAAASSAACSSGAQALAAGLGLSDGQARLVGCQLSASVPDPVLQDASSTPPPPPDDSGGDAAATGGGTSGGGGGRGVSTTVLAAAIAGAVVALIAAAVVVVVVRKRRRTRNNKFRDMDSAMDEAAGGGGASAATGSAETKSLRQGAVKPFQVDSDDSAETGLIMKSMKPTKRVRISNNGTVGDVGAGGGGSGSHDPIGSDAQSSRSIRSSKMRPGSSNLKGASPRPSGYGSDLVAVSGGGGGLEAEFLAIVPALTAEAAGPLEPAVMTSGPAAAVRTGGRHLIGTSGASEIQAGPYRPDSPARQGRSSAGVTARRARASHPGCPIPTGDEDLVEDPSGGAIYEEPSFPARCSRLGTDSRFSNGAAGGAAPAGVELYDYFGFDGSADSFGPTSNVMALLPTNGGSGSGPGRLAARRSSDGGGGGAGGAGRRSCRRSKPALRRSNGGDLGLHSSSGLSSDDEEERDGSRGGSGGGRQRNGDGSKSRSSATPTPPASPMLCTTGTLAVAQPLGSGGDPISYRPSTLSPWQVATLRAVQYSFALPGADSDPGDSEPLPYGIDPVRTDSPFGSEYGTVGDLNDRDLLRVQSRRPAFLDRTGGTLAAAVAATVTAPLPPGDMHGGRTYSRTLVPRIEPRRGGFIRRNTVLPHLGLSPSYLQHVSPWNGNGRSPCCSSPGNPPGMPAGAVPHGQNAWSVPASADNSPGSGQVGFSLWAGVVGGRRRSSASTVGLRSSARGAVAPSGPSGVSCADGGGARADPGPDGVGGAGSNSQPGSGDDGSTGRRLRAPQPLPWADGQADPAADDEAAAAAARQSTSRPATARTAAAAADADGSRPRTIRKPPQIQVQSSVDLGSELDPGEARSRVSGAGVTAVVTAPAASTAPDASGHQRRPGSGSAGTGAAAAPAAAAAAAAARPSTPPWLSPQTPGDAAGSAAAAADGTPRRLPPLSQRRAAHSDFGTTVYVASAGSAANSPADLGGAPRAHSRSVFVTVGPVIPPEPLPSPPPAPLPTPSQQPSPPPLPSPEERDGAPTATAAAGEAGQSLDSPPPGPGGCVSRREHRASEDSNASSSGQGPLEELSPAFGPLDTMRARRMYGRSSSCGSSNNGSFGRHGHGHGLGGLVDKEVEANAAGGTARLAMMRRLAVGPPRPAWGLVHAGVVPFKRSIASLQYLKSVKDRPGTAGGPQSGTAASGAGGGASPLPLEAMLAGAASGGASATAAGAGPGLLPNVPPSSINGRILHRNSTGSMRNGSFHSSEMSGPFLRLVGDT